MAKNYRKKSVLVTGGTSGIGLGIVRRYLRGGFCVVINYHNDKKRADNIKKNLQKEGFIINKDFFILDANIADEGEFFMAARKIPKAFSGLEILVNNAGILRRGKFKELKQQDWLDVFGVNVFGMINVSKWFALNCSQARAIINIGSIRGLPHISRTQNMIYSVSKACIPTVTAVLAKEMGPKIRVNAIIPGTIDTKQRQGLTPEEKLIFGEKNSIIGRLGKTEEVAELCIFLTSRNAEYITGSSFIMDGGYNINYIR